MNLSLRIYSTFSAPLTHSTSDDHQRFLGFLQKSYCSLNFLPIICINIHIDKQRMIFCRGRIQIDLWIKIRNKIGNNQIALVILFLEKSNLKDRRINVNLIRRQTEVDRKLFYTRKQVENKVCSRGISFFGKIIFDNSSLTCFNFILRFKQIHVYLANFQIRLSQERVFQRNFFIFDLRLILNHRISQISFLPRTVTHHPVYTECIVICEPRFKSG